MYVVDIFYVRYLTENGNQLSIGGVESYITQLTHLVYSMGCEVRIFQYAEYDFIKKLDFVTIYGYSHKGKPNDGFLFKKAYKSYKNGNKYLTIIANDTLIPNYKVKNSIAIQHGIGFDSCFGKKEPLWINFLKRQIRAFPIIKKLENVDEVVCVDNNFICWYRTQTSFRNVKLTPILNFTEIGPPEVYRNEDTTHIVFARRFVEIRGTRLFIPVAKLLLDKYPNIEITFAGEGPDENYIKEALDGYNRVHYTKYSSDESIHFHCNFDISVVPTIYSEGTSLSLLEAMSAHCAVICTNIGGMTNIVLDGFNGIMVSPEEDNLFKALCLLIENRELRKQISENGYATVCASFSLKKWQDKWKDVLIEKLSKL